MKYVVCRVAKHNALSVNFYTCKISKLNVKKRAGIAIFFAVYAIDILQTFIYNVTSHYLMYY